jgi:hypothetical protein
MLSRTEAFHCAAVKVAFATAVKGVEYAMICQLPSEYTFTSVDAKLLNMADPEFIDMSPYADADLPSDTERAWAAGFFDGEGWIGANKAKGYTYLKMAVVQTGSTITLDRFNAAIGGVGSIYERSRNVPDNWTKGWVLQVNAINRVVFAVNLLWPWLSQPKRDQTTAAFANRATYRATWSPDFRFARQQITDEQVRGIRRAIAEGGRTQTAIAKEYGVTPAYITNIKMGRTRSKVT